MSIEEHRADIWRSIHGLTVETLVNNLAQARTVNEQLNAQNAKQAAEIAALKQTSTPAKKEIP
ncbi:MAG TPA: hypothetical protein VHN11_21055 [Xanthobacteraceae bacterium]|jgi:cell division protein FtsB|nr:hypothetical protein [Xanthobacteraceae bacterium]